MKPLEQRIEYTTEELDLDVPSLEHDAIVNALREHHGCVSAESMRVIRKYRPDVAMRIVRMRTKYLW